MAARLVLRGDVVLNRRSQYCLREQLPGLVVGTVSAHRNGDGWLMPDDATASVYLPSQQLREVMHGDRVAVRVEGPGFRGRPQGVIVDVLERRMREVVGRLYVEAGVAYVVADNPRITHRVLVPVGALGAAVSGQVVIVEITQPPSRTAQPVGRVTRVLGDHGAPGMETEIAIHSHGLPLEFPETAVREAQAFGQTIPVEAIEGREDLRSTALVTIDSEDARDFDDAVYCERASGGWKVIVAIADVGHYVKPGSALDREARERGTSVYFPNRVLPMLPEALSNGLCSLVPDEDRLALCCELRVRDDGASRARGFAAVMRSAARLAYRDVGAFLERPDARHVRLEKLRERPAGAAWRVQGVHARSRRGALELDTRAQAQVRRAGHDRCARRAVAQRRTPADRGMHDRGQRRRRALLDRLHMPTLYRVHGLPELDRLERCGSSCASSDSGCRRPRRSSRST